MRARVIAAVVGLAFVVTGGVLWARSGDGDGGVAGGRDYQVGGDRTGLPPDDFEALAALYDPVLEPLGLRLTRGGLADGPGSAADARLEGRHLALYVEPISGTHTSAQYLETLLTSSRVFLPDVFERWPELASMDVCQEPPPGVDDRPVPPQVTVLEVTVAQAAAIDWETIDLAGLLREAQTRDFGFFVNDDLEAERAWQAARTAAGRRTAKPPS